MRSGLVFLAAGLLTVGLLAGCSSSSSVTAASAVRAGRSTTVETSTASTERARVELRPVLQCTAPTTTATGPTPSGRPSTTPAVADPTQSQILPTDDGAQCFVGPSSGDGHVFAADATAAQLPGTGWGVTVSLRPGADGEDVWNVLAAECYSRDQTCPTGQLAIVVDGRVVSYPVVQQPAFSGSVQVSGSFTEAEARVLADVLLAGAG